MNQKNLLKKIIVIGIIILFFGISIAPAICGVSFKPNVDKIEVKNKSQDSAPLTFYIFDRSGMKQKEVILSKDIAENISNMFEELRYRFESDPLGYETQVLQVDFVDLLDLYGLIPEGLSKDYVLSLLNPPWVKFLQRILKLTSETPFLRGTMLNFLSNYFNVDDNDMESIFFEQQDFITKYVLLSNLGSVGTGIPFPFFMLPRPRGIVAWAASKAYTYVGSLIQDESFLASGGQQALALGFMGMGISVYVILFAYALIGYAAFLVIRAEKIENIGPPNKAPVISNEYPVHGAVDVPVSLSELSFRISDADGDRMSYSVTTSPNIGSGSGIFKKNGVYKIPVSGLKYNKGYSWTVEVSDGTDTTVKEFSFFTEMLPINPFDEGWSYRKKVTVDHDLVDGDFSNFPVLVSVIDTDLIEKVQGDGDDILFMDGPGVANRLFHEIEFFDDSNGELVAWVRIPDLDDDIDTVFYMYYGNSDCDSQQYPDFVWNDDYIAIYHMGGSDYTKIDDSTSNDLDVVGKSGNPMFQEVGKVGYCVDFNDDQLYVNDNDLLSFTSGSNNDEPMTIEAWVKFEGVGGSTNPIICKYGSAGKEWLFRKFTDDLGQLYLVDDSSVASISRKTVTELNIDNTGWNYICGVYGGSNTGSDINMVLDGLVDNGEIWTGANYNGMKNKNENMYIGGYLNPYSGWKYWYGLIDEIRISNIARSSDWLKTCYNTMNDPSSFMSFGPEETAP